MPFRRTVSTHGYCFLCSATKNITIVPLEARLQAYTKKGIFISKNNRCCPKHLLKKRFFEDELNLLRIHSHHSTIEIEDLQNFMENLSLHFDSNILQQSKDFSISENRIKVLTGRTWDEILSLSEKLTSMRNTSLRNIHQALIVFLFRLRCGNSNATISALLGLNYEQQVSDFCGSILHSFEKDVLPKSFGFEAVSRDDLIRNHTSPIARMLYDLEDQLVLIFDGTYIRHQKSQNNNYQRKSYSGQKKVPLCKPFTICTTNGYIVDVPRPFYVTQNDAEIMKIIFSDPKGIKTLVREGDIFIVDRGFRDVKAFLEEQGYVVLMPALKGKRSQLSTIESNETRWITKLRWVVEAVPGAIGQQYKLLHHQLDNKLIPSVGLYCRVACYLQNEYGKRLNSDVPLSEEIIGYMKHMRDVDNTLATEVEEKRLNRFKTAFKKLSSSEILDFPQLEDHDLKILFTGSYQLSQAVSYLAEIMDDNNKLNVEYLQETPEIIQIKVRSRHINRKTYKAYVHYDPEGSNHSAILRYCCDCANGRRTVGCCSHVAAVIYYLSRARYLSRIVRPAEILIKMFDQEQVEPVINEDSDLD